MIRGTEDWVRLSETICGDVAAAVGAHDRMSLVKKFPATLVPM